MNNNSRILLSALAGLAAGAALGLLLAPRKGCHTRDDLGSSLNNLGHQIKDNAENKLNHFENIRDRINTSIGNRFIDEDDFNDHVEHV